MVDSDEDVPPRLIPPVRSLNIEPALPVNLLPIAPNTVLNALVRIPAKLVGLEDSPELPLDPEDPLELDVPVEYPAGAVTVPLASIS